MGEEVYWGKPSVLMGVAGIPIGQISFDPIEISHIDAGRYIDDGVVFPKNQSSISFDIPVTPDLRELFGELTKKRRLPRKLKKAIKVRVAKRFYTKVKKIKLVRK